MDKYKIIGPVTCGAHGVILEAVLRNDRASRVAIKRMLICKNRQSEASRIPLNVLVVSGRADEPDR